MGCSCAKDAQGSQPSRRSQYEDKNPSNAPLRQSENHQNEGAPLVPQVKPRYVRSEEQKQLQQIYLHPQKLVALSILNEKEFIAQVKKYKISNLCRFKGHEMDPPLTLASGRKPNTLNWNPFTFALVTGKTNIYTFVVKECNFNLRGMFEVQKEQIHMNSEDQEQEGVIEILKLMIENNSSLLKQVLNDLSHLIKSAHVKRIIPFIMRSQEPAKLMEIFLNSKCFISLYINKVKCISSQKYKGSFEFFFEKYLTNVAKDPSCNKVMAKVFQTAPFNLGFGSSIILNHRKSKQTFEGLEAIIAKCSDLRDFDVYRFGALNDLDFSQMEKNISQEVKQENLQNYTRFIQSLRGRNENRGRIEKQIQEILQATKNGDLAAFKKKLGALEMSRETICQIQGLESDDLQIEIQALKHKQTFQLGEMNPLEIACLFGHTKILLYLTEELGLKSQKEISMLKKADQNQLDKLSFIIGPIFKQDSSTFSTLLDLSHLWTYEDLLQIMTLLKQTKWFQGFQIVLASRFAQENFCNRSLQEKFRFVRDILIFPFKIDVQDDSMSDASGIFDEDQPKDEVQMSSRKNVLSNDEKIALRKIIKSQLCQDPYIGAFLFQEFAQRRDTYKEVAEVNILPEKFADQIESLRKCVEKISEMDMNDYIVETNGGVVQKLMSVISISISQDESEQKLNEMQSIELQYLVDKLTDHPAYAKVCSEQMESQEGNQN